MKFLQIFLIEGSGLLGCDAVSLGLCFPTFQRNVVSSTSRFENEALCYFEGETLTQQHTITFEKNCVSTTVI